MSDRQEKGTERNCWCDEMDGKCKLCQRREARVPEPGVIL